VASESEQGKVVDLQQRQAVQAQQSDRLGNLIKQCRGITQRRMATLVAAVFDRLDDTLFNTAEKSATDWMQSQYFDALREARKKRQLIERLFQEGVTREFARFGQGPQPAPVPAPPQQASTLALVEDESLELNLAIASMSAKAENRHAREIYALEHRFAVLAGGTKIDADNNPLAPKKICENFVSAIGELDVELTIRLTALKLFDKLVVEALGEVYDECNRTLVTAGVLPQLSYGANFRAAPGQRGPADPLDASRGPSSEGAAEVERGAPHPPQQTLAAEQMSDLATNLFEKIQGLFAARHRVESVAGTIGGGERSPVPVFSAPDLLNALSLLQMQTASTAGMGLAASADVTPVLVKRELLGELQRLGSGTEEHRVATADEDTIDLVGMLFEFILQDRNLPTQMQALLARMQIPYLKCALLDKALFQRKEHPARLLLDEMAQAGLSWSEEADRDGRVLEKVRSVVETLLKDFDDDVQIFQRLLADFREFSQSTRKRAEVAELRAAEAARGRERLQGARKSAAKEVLTRIEGKALPEVIRHLLTRPWANVLVLTILRQGEGSHAWKSALRVADELVWAAQPKASDGERNRLRALMPELEKALRQGLAMVAYHENDVRTLLADLNAYYAMQLDPAKAASSIAEASPAAAAPAESPSAPAPSAEESFVDEIAAQPQTEELASAEVERIEDEHYELAQGLKVGTWIEFRPAQGRAERAKLSWISPISAKYLFVNRKGLKVADKTVWSLAAEFRAGRALLLEDVPLFDRALDAIVERLKGTVGQDGAETPAAAPSS
jgi:hypothetical protein